MQNMNTAPARNSFKADARPQKISVPAGKIPTPAPNTGNGATPGSAIKGYSGNGVISGKIKI